MDHWNWFYQHAFWEKFLISPNNILSHKKPQNGLVLITTSDWCEYYMCTVFNHVQCSVMKIVSNLTFYSFEMNHLNWIELEGVAWRGLKFSISIPNERVFNRLISQLAKESNTHNDRAIGLVQLFKITTQLMAVDCHSSIWRHANTDS